MKKDSVNAETSEPDNPAGRDEALKAATKNLAEASMNLTTAARHAGAPGGDRAYLELLSEEASDVYMRVAALKLHFEAASQQNPEAGT